MTGHVRMRFFSWNGFFEHCFRLGVGRKVKGPLRGLYTVYDWIKRLKGIWWMPWRAEAMKDVIHCDKVWGAVNRL